MRRLITSATFDEQLVELLVHGSSQYSGTVIEAARRRVFQTLTNMIQLFPAAKRVDPKLGLRVYPISKTPFVVLYDFDDSEVRIHFILHRHADLDTIDPGSAQW